MTFAWSTASAPSSCRLAPRLREGGKRWRYRQKTPSNRTAGGLLVARDTVFWDRELTGVVRSTSASVPGSRFARCPSHSARCRCWPRRAPGSASMPAQAPRRLRTAGSSGGVSPIALLRHWCRFGRPSAVGSHTPRTRKAGKGVRTALYRQAQLPCISKSYRSVTRASPIPS